MNEYIGMLMQSRTQAHIYHLQTTSYAKHKALGDYYEGIVNLIDGIVESYMGKYGILTDITMPVNSNNLNSDKDIISYFDKLIKYVQLIRKKLPNDTYLENQYDEIETLINSTIYKLKFLA